VAYEHKLVREVEFSETDMAGIMHFSNFFRYMEAAEHGFFRTLGLSIHTTSPEPLGWPRVHAACDFRFPLRFEDSVEIRLLVMEKKEKSITYSFIFRKLNETPPREVARGKVTVVCVRYDRSAGQMKGVPIPEAIAQKIDVAPPELFAS
jgi:YbgC/YbaW family acyl-CoA thioester hydrolase